MMRLLVLSYNVELQTSRLFFDAPSHHPHPSLDLTVPQISLSEWGRGAQRQITNHSGIFSLPKCSQSQSDQPSPQRDASPVNMSWQNLTVQSVQLFIQRIYLNNEYIEETMLLLRSWKK